MPRNMADIQNVVEKFAQNVDVEFVPHKPDGQTAGWTDSKTDRTDRRLIPYIHMLLVLIKNILQEQNPRVLAGMGAGIAQSVVCWARCPA